MPLRFSRLAAWRPLALALAVIMTATNPDPAHAQAQSRPNIVIVQTDDQTDGFLSQRYMPRLADLMKHDGTRFDNSFALPPFCCPSRAGLITGQYPHNHGIIGDGAYGALRDKENVLSVWLQEAGYRTGFAGKFLNGYPEYAGLEPAPGYDKWFGMVTMTDYNALMSRNGTKVTLGEMRRDYTPYAITRFAETFIRKSSERPDPFFFYLAPRAPHIGKPMRNSCNPRSAPEDVGAFSGEALPKAPSFNEKNVDDKPAFIRQRPRLGAEKISKLRTRHQCRLASLRSVDRSIGWLHDTLVDTGEWSDTVLIFTSDNGYFLGQHRLTDEKALPYEDAIRVPLWIRLPDWLPDEEGRRAELVSNVDLAPSLLDLADAEACSSSACRVMDGRSLVDLLKGDASAWPQDRAILIEQEDLPFADSSVPCSYSSVRTDTYKYTEYVQYTPQEGCVITAEAELYELSEDPFELRNRIGTDPAVEAELRARLESLRTCSGIEGRDPAPPGASNCE